MTRWLLLFALLSGCAHSDPPERSYVCLSHNLAFCEPLWRCEAERRFRNPVLLICHGDGKHGRWWLVPDRPYQDASMEATVQLLCALYPHRPIVVVSCNEDGILLHAPRGNVWYARKTVSSCPATFDPMVRFWHPSWAVSIEEFVEAEH